MFWHDKLLKLFTKLKQLKILQPLQQECGAILVFTAVAIPIFLAFVGFGFDVGNLYMHKARLQNVADAAALAGAKEYLDKLDISEDGGTINGGDTPDNHPNADRVANEYITKNRINLPNSTLSNDYNSLKIRKSTTDSKTPFYRVGLKETVDLHFLPIISGIPKNQIVRAEAIAIAVKGTTETIPGSGGTNTEEGVVNPSIFDNLFTFSEWLFTKNLTLNNGTLVSSFTGTMVYTHLNNGEDTASSQYNNYQPSEFFHYETDNGSASGEFPYTHMYQEAVNTNVLTSGGTINDASINTFYDTKAYLAAFENKLNDFHIDVNTSQLLKTSEINNTNGSLYNQELTIDGKAVRQKDDIVYIDTGNNSDKNYYLVDTNTNNYLMVDGEKVHYVEFPRSYGNTSVRCYEKNGKYYILNSNNEPSDCYIDKATNQAYKGDKQLWVDNHKLYIPLDEWGKNKEYINDNLYDCIDRNNFFQPQNNPKYTVHVNAANCNVFHINKVRSDGQVSQSFDLEIDEPVTIGNENTPIYLLVDGIYQFKISGNASTTRRPIILVFLSEGTGQLKYEFTGGEFKGTIYAPVSTFEHVKGGGTFRGNMIAKTINIQSSQSITWIQENYLEHYQYETDSSGNYVLDENGNRKIVYQTDSNGQYILDENGYKKPVILYMDEAVKAVSDATKQKIETAHASVTEEERAVINDEIAKTLAKEIYDNGSNKQKGRIYNLLFPDKFPELYEEFKAENQANVNGHPEVNVPFADLPESERFNWWGSNTNVYEALYNKLTAAEQAQLYDKFVENVKNNMGNNTWYNNILTFDDKKSFYNGWQKLYNKYKGTKFENLLWPWNKHFNIEAGEDQTVTTRDNVRLINPRLEANPFNLGFSVESGS